MSAGRSRGFQISDGGVLAPPGINLARATRPLITTQAIFTGLQTPCAGILVLSSVLVDDNMSIDETPKPVLLCVGDTDPYVSVAAATATQKAIAESAKVEVELNVYNKMEHAACDEAIAACADWLAKVLKE